MPRKKKQADLGIDPIIGKVQLNAPQKAALKFLMAPNKGRFNYDYGYVSQGKVIPTNNHACHADLKRFGTEDRYNPYPKGPIDGLYTFSVKKADHKRSVNFFKWFIDKSPWAQVWLPMNAEFAAEKGLIVRDVTLPANLIGNAMIASRLPGEWPEVTDKFLRMLKEKGVHPNVAFLFGPNVGDDQVWSGQYDNGHLPYSGPFFSKGWAENFAHGIIGSPFPPYNEHQMYYPTVGVWEPKIYERYGISRYYSEFLEETYPLKKPGAKVDGRMFKVNVNKGVETSRSWAQWVAIARAESKRMFPKKENKNDGHLEQIAEAVGVGEQPKQ